MDNLCHTDEVAVEYEGDVQSEAGALLEEHADKAEGEDFDLEVDIQADNQVIREQDDASVDGIVARTLRVVEQDRDQVGQIQSGAHNAGHHWENKE